MVFAGVNLHISPSGNRMSRNGFADNGNLRLHPAPSELPAPPTKLLLSIK